VPSLFVIRGNDQGSRFEIDETLVRVGRDASNAVQLHDTEVSRQHAEIRFAGQTCTILDLASSNGTFVNGRRVANRELASGDQIQLGRTLMLYTGPAEESREELLRAVDIAPAGAAEDHSRIIRSLSQAEGSRIFELDAAAPENAWLARARGNLQVMYRTALAVSHTLDIDQLLHRIMELIFEWVDADRGCIMLFDPAGKGLVPKVRRTRRGPPADRKITISRTILDYVTERNEGVLTSDARQDRRWDAGGSILQAGVREAICVPMQGRYDVVGVIYVDTSISPQEVIRKGGGNKFTEDHLKLMIAIGHQAALAVEDTRHYSALVQAERLAAVGQTVATLSHHVKNILQGIRGGSYLIELGLAEHDESIVRKGWTIVEKNQNKISSLVMDMLTFSKEREPDLEVADIDQTLADVAELTQARADEMNVEFTWRRGEPMPEMIFDPEGLHRAVLNVATNAIDAAAEAHALSATGEPGEAGQAEPPEQPRPAGTAAGEAPCAEVRPGPGRVALDAEYDPKAAVVRIAVEDNGPGIPADEIDDLFSPFVSRKRGRGTGLGLPVSRKIMQEHGGRITVESEPGRGSRFILELPAVLPEATRPTAH
jgi:two-component system, NtrC family, sensor kinase